MPEIPELEVPTRQAPSLSDDEEAHLREATPAVLEKSISLAADNEYTDLHGRRGGSPPASTARSSSRCAGLWWSPQERI
jgi:hypothetical protein